MSQQFSAFDVKTHTRIEDSLTNDLQTITKTVGDISDYYSNPYVNTLLSAIAEGFQPVLIGDAIFTSRSNNAYKHMVTLINLDFHTKDILEPDVEARLEASPEDVTYRYVVNHTKGLYLDRKRNCVSHVTVSTDTGKPEFVRTEALPLLLAIGVGLSREHAPLVESVKPGGDHFGYWFSYRGGYSPDAEVGFDADYPGASAELCGDWCGDALSVTNDRGELEGLDELPSPFANNLYAIHETDEEIHSMLRERRVGLLDSKNLTDLSAVLNTEY